jgi:hypothetical protein
VTFNDILSQTMAMLQQHGRVSYRALKRQFAIDDAFLEDLKYELIKVQQRAVDHDGTMLVWTEDASAAATPLPASSPSTSVPPLATGQRPQPLSYTLLHLAEKILTSKSALEGERKQVTVLFADLKGSMELLADRAASSLAGSHTPRTPRPDHGQPCPSDHTTDVPLRPNVRPVWDNPTPRRCIPHRRPPTSPRPSASADAATARPPTDLAQQTVAWLGHCGRPAP